MRWSIVLALALGALFVGAALWMGNRSSPGPASAQSGASVQASPTVAPPRSSAATQTSEGQVTIAVTWQGGLVFAVVMDTHSVNLDGYDLEKLAVLRTDQGREARPSGWDAPNGGHHRQGTLTFPATTTGGSPLIESTTGTVELTIRNVGDVPERVFRWTVPGSDQLK